MVREHIQVKMRLGLTYLVLLCSLICISNGVPPKGAGRKPNFGAVYTKEEDQFIVNQLLNILDYTTKPQSRSVWNKIAKEHYENRIRGTRGFIHERTAESLRQRFLRGLMYNRPDAAVKVPEILIDKFMENEAGSRQPYTKEEDDFLMKELSQPSYPYVFSRSTYEALRANHEIKRAARIPGFEQERTEGSLRNHLVSMKHAGKFPKEILEKINLPRIGSSSRRPRTSNQQAGLPVINEEQYDDDFIADMIEELQNTDYEIDFSKLQ